MDESHRQDVGQDKADIGLHLCEVQDRQNLSGVGHITKNVAVSGWVGIDCEGT